MSRRSSLAHADHDESARDPQGVPVGPVLVREEVPTPTPPPARGRDWPLRRFDRLHVVRKLGEGGMGVVYLAYDPHLDRKVALKVLGDENRLRLKSNADTRIARTRLFREARALAKLAHPNVVTVYDVGRRDDDVYLCMEYIEGETLREWLQRSERSTEQVIEVMLQAGRGLCSAHAAGIVHRDFKPENVMVDRHGRVLVLDFGLVQIGQTHAQVPSEAGSVEISGIDTANQSITVAGCILGTPAYMAPEQILGQTCDAAADQFAYCLTFYEALYGARPFAGRNLQDRLRSIRTTQLRRSHAVPPWLHELLVTGLRAQAELRHPSLACIVEAIESQERRLRWRKRWLQRLLFISPALMTICLLVALMMPAPEQDPCPDRGQAWHSIWGPGRKQQIHSAITKTGVAWAEDTWTRVESRIDAHVRDWKRLHDQVCRETLVEQTHDDADMAVRMRCLELDMARFAALGQTLVESDESIVTNAVQAIDAMPELSRCGDAEGLRADLPWPEDVEQLATVQVLRRELAEAEVLRETGRWPAALSRLAELQADVEDANFKPTLAEFHWILAVLHRELADPRMAAEHAWEAMLYAQASGHRRIAAEVTIFLIFVQGYLQGDVAEGQELIQAAYARVQAVAPDRALEAALLRNEAVMFAMVGELERSAQFLESSLNKYREHYGSYHRMVAYALHNVAYSRNKLNRPAASIELYRSAIAIIEEVFGPKHPSLALVHKNLATSLHRLGRVHAARDHAELALALCEPVTAVGQLSCAWQQQTLALAYADLGALDKSQRLLESLRFAQAQAGRRGRPEVRWAAIDLAEIHRRRGQFSVALDMARIGVAQSRASRDVVSPSAGGPGSTMALRARRVLAEVLIELGELTAAGKHIEQALLGLDQLSHERGHEWAEIQRVRSRLALASGEQAAAVRAADAAVELAQGYFGEDSPQLATFYFDRAKAHWSMARRAEARADLERAISLRRRSHGQDSHALMPLLIQRGLFNVAESRTDAARDDFARAQALFNPAEYHSAKKLGLFVGLARLRELTHPSRGRDRQTRRLWAQAREARRQWPGGPGSY